MPRTIALGQDENCHFAVLDRRHMERAIAELVKIAVQVGLSAEDLIQMLDSGVTIAQVLQIVEEKVERTTLAA